MRYQCIKQHDYTDCGAACLATIAKHYGSNLAISRIREIAGTDKQGTNMYGLIKAAEQLGFSAKGVKGNEEAFFSEFPLPAIAHVIIDKNLLHYVVIHKIGKKEIVIADPAKGIVRYAPEEFFKIWTGVLVLLMPDIKYEKSNEKQGTFSRFFKLLLPQKKLLLHIFMASLLLTIFGIIASFYFQFIMDDVVSNSLKRSLMIVSIGVISLYLFKSILEFFRNHLMLYLSQRLDIPLNLGYYNHVMELPMSFFGTRRSGEIISRFADAAKIREAVSGATLTIMIDTFMALAGGIVLFRQNSFLFGIALVLLFLYGMVVFAYNQPVRKINEKIMEDNAEVTSYLVESLSGIETIKAFNSEKQAQLEIEKLFIKFLKSIFKNGFLTNGEKTITEAIGVIGETIILWIGTNNVLSGSMSIGELITFNALLTYFLTPVKNLINLQPALQTALVAAERLSEILDLTPEKDENEEKRLKEISLKQDIYIKNLDFRYGTRALVLKNIDLHIKTGQKIAFVGGSGSGKTTLAKLLMHFYEWENGEILFGNCNIKDINRETLRNKIAYISQDIFLFSGSIRENLILGNEKASLEEVIESCKLSKADEFIEKYPTRYETLLEENGANLSGGQKQRLAIARALLKKPDILIMDEATSNLDSITEKAIEKTINNLSESITTIIIAHRLSTIRNCDKIFVFENGKIIETGTHQELIQRQDYYYRLWHDQIAEIEEKL